MLWVLWLWCSHIISRAVMFWGVFIRVWWYLNACLAHWDLHSLLQCLHISAPQLELISYYHGVHTHHQQVSHSLAVAITHHFSCVCWGPELLFSHVSYWAIESRSRCFWDKIFKSDHYSVGSSVIVKGKVNFWICHSKMKMRNCNV